MYCSQCGTQASTDARFCTKCGASLGTIAPSASNVRQTLGTPGFPKRPKGVWLILGFYIFSLGWTLLSFALISLGVITPNPAQQVYFANLGFLDYLSTFGLGVVTIAGAVLLFCLRRTAILLFGITLALNVGLTFIHVATTNWSQAFGDSVLVSAVVVWVTMGVILWYARNLARQGILT